MWLFYMIVGIWIFDGATSTTPGRTAYIEIVFCENTKQGTSVYSEKLEGKFASIGLLNKAQGDVLQIHPFGLCNISNSDAFYEDEWVGVVKLTIPSRESRPCNGTVQKVLGAVKKGAKAVIFDITDNPMAAHQLNTNNAMVKQPVIIMSGGPAKKMMQIVSRQKVLKAKISWQLEVNQTKSGSSEYVDMVIFMTCFILITVTCFVLLLKIKWKQTKKESSLAKMAFDAVSKMESKKYAAERSGVVAVKTIKEKQRERKLSIRSCSVAGFSCVICLEEFKDGQEIRVVSCGHEFHLKCVDPWLLTNYTCPLCMLNIVEREGKGIKTESRCSLSFRHLFQCCFTSTSLSSSSMVYSVALDETTSNDETSFSSNDTVESLHFYPTSSSHNLWTSHKNAESEAGGQSAANNTSLPHVVPCANTLKDTRQLSVSLPSSVCQSGVTLQNTALWRIMQQEKRALQVADRGIRKYSDLGEAV